MRSRRVTIDSAVIRLSASSTSIVSYRPPQRVTKSWMLPDLRSMLRARWRYQTFIVSPSRSRSRATAAVSTTQTPGSVVSDRMKISNPSAAPACARSSAMAASAPVVAAGSSL